MTFAPSYRFTHWLSLVVIYLVIVAGSVVRITGSGMGCPDWPKCFGQWVPPTEASQLPDDAEEMLKEKRVKKAFKFAKYLRFLGLDATAQQLENDPYLDMEEGFNAAKTWTEYVNRLLGFLAGNIVLLLFFWTFLRYRKNRLLLMLSFVNLILMGVQGWFGSIVVASNLVPWTITVHLFLALVILFIQIYLVRMTSNTNTQVSTIPKIDRRLILIAWVIIVGQLFLGTQVREYIDELTRMGLGRDQWSEYFGLTFFIHRSCSWLVLLMIVVLWWRSEKSSKLNFFRYALLFLAIELSSGVFLAYLDLPGAVQVAHLLFACVLFGLFSFAVLDLRRKTLE